MPIPPYLTRAVAGMALLLLLACLAGREARAQQEPAPADVGSVVGRVIDATSGTPAEGVAVTLSWPAGGGAEPRQETRVTDAQGAFELRSVPAGRYELHFAKPGYRESTVSDFVVATGQEKRADVSLTPEAAAAPPEPSDVEEFVVIASPVAEILAASRMDADELINTLGAAEFDKLAIGDVAEALKFVPGVNIVEGQFAVIRGLEDRYSSSLYNGAPVPSPDPDRQSVQLDLFASDIVSDLVIAKTFGPDTPGNSAAGAIDILTHQYPEELTFKVSPGSGFNENAWDRFLEGDTDVGAPDETDGSDTLESDFVGMFGGRTELLERELRFKGVVANEIDYETQEGSQEERQPKLCLVVNLACDFDDIPTRSGGLAFGELDLTGGKYDFTQSERTDQFTAYGGVGFDLDETGDHKLDGSVFYTKFDTDIGQLKENGFLPGYDYGILADLQTAGEPIIADQVFFDFATFGSQLRGIRNDPGDVLGRGAWWSASFQESKSFDIERDLLLYQINGDHQIEAVEGLSFTWAANHAETTQKDTALGFESWYEADDLNQIPTRFPVRVSDLGSGQYAMKGGIVASTNDVDETQNFGRLDATYEMDLTESVAVELTTGGWYERADRDVESTFLEGPTVGGVSQFAILGGSLQELGANVFDSLDRQADGKISATRESSNEAKREIEALSLGLKSTFWDDFDVLGGLRIENIFIESINDPFTGEQRFGGPATFPEAYLFFDRLDNPARIGECSPRLDDPTQCETFGRPVVFNDELLGIKLPLDPVTGKIDLLDEQSIRSLVDSEIDELYYLPTVGLTHRVTESINLRAAWSQTVARPSFREIGFYVSVEPGTDDLTVGNPQLKLSEVESYDVRAEYLGDDGDVAALSLFYKTIDDPIESIVIRNPLNFEQSGSALYRTFFNNPNEATLLGLEIEARKNFGFIGPEWLEYFSVGGNFTYIDAEVDRTEAEIQRAQPFFLTAPGENGRYNGLEKSRRLFGQPEWIANADISFDQPDWGSKATLAFFAISDVLDAAGSAFITQIGVPFDFTLDRYVDSFYQLDLILSQRVYFEGLVFKTSIKNLTDSKRGIIYDGEQTQSEIHERSYRVGRDYSFSLSYTYEF